MSWVSRIDTEYIITCGDGRQFFPYWMNANKDVEYNISEFNFPNQEGTFIDRRLRKGNKYSIEIVFQGENHLDDQERFEISARDRRPWVIEHPLYGRLVVQPAALTFDNSALNTTKITGTVLETTERGELFITIYPRDEIAEKKELSDAAGAALFEADPSNTQSIQVQANSFYQSGFNVGATPLQAENYFNLFNEALSAAYNVTQQPLAAIRAVQRLIEAPALFEINLRNRINILVDQFYKLISMVPNFGSIADKVQFETNAGAIVTTMCVAASNPQEDDYENMMDVIDIIDIVLATSNLYIATLDSLQSANGGNVDSYIPGYDFITSVTDEVSYTISSLFEIAMDAKQERTVYIEEDSNLILLAHRFYGMEADDSTIEQLRTTNNIGLSEILGIHQGREILYYV